VIVTDKIPVTLSGALAPEAGCDGVIELDDHNKPDAKVGAENAEERAERIESLTDDNASADGGAGREDEIILDELGTRGPAPGGIQEKAKDQDVRPVDEERGAVLDVVGQEPGGKGQHRDGEKEGEMNPGEVSVRALQVIELRLLSNPKDAQGHEAEKIDQEIGEQIEDRVLEIGLRPNELLSRDVKVEEKQRHGDTEDAVANGGEAFHAGAGNAVVRDFAHPA
jgi:hypothetical protein